MQQRGVSENTAVFVRKTGGRGQRAAKLRRTACLILDVRMPGMGGLELQRRLAAENFRTPIIFITANGGVEVSAEALSGGAVACLRKPFSQESLLRALRSALARPGGPTGATNQG